MSAQRIRPGSEGMRSRAPPLPEQLIRQPPSTPFLVSISLMPHFIQAPPRFRKLQTVLLDIGREIIHAVGTHTGDFLPLFIDIDLFRLVGRRFD